MAKLRHLAISVADIEAAAKFYTETFGLERVGFASTPYGDGLSLTDGVMNLTLLTFHTEDAAGDERGKDFVGVHHFGFVVEDLDATGARIEANGGRFHRELLGGGGIDYEKKYRDPNGIVFDISDKGWKGAR